MFSEGGELGPEFSEGGPGGEMEPGLSDSEKETLRPIKDQFEKGEIGGPGDKPAREEWEKPDPAWRDLPAETKNEALAKLRGGEELEKGDEEPPIEAKEAYRQIEIVREGSTEELFFKALEKNYPELGISVKPPAADAHGNRIRGATGVWIEPNKNAEIHQRLAHISQENQAMKVLGMKNWDKREADARGYQLESQGDLPPGTTKRVCARLLRAEIDRLNSEGPRQWANEIKGLEQVIVSLGVEPFSDEELESLLLEKVIKPEFGPPRQSTTKESV